MFDSPKQQVTDNRRTYDTESCSAIGAAGRVPEQQQTLGLKVESIYYSTNRIESSVARIRALLLGEHSPSEDCCSGLSCIEDGVNSIKGTVERIEKALDSIIYRISGD